MSSYRLNIGDISCMVVQEAASEAEIATWNQRYSNSSEEEFQDALEKIGHEGTMTARHMNILYIEVDGTKILVDSGFGEEHESPVMGLLIPNLRKAGIEPEDIDIVYITHFHGDHYAGLLRKDGEPSFPNARYITRQSEWDYWMSEEVIEKFGERAAGYTPVFNKLKDKFSFVKAGDEIATGVRVLDISGHTMGLSGLMIESNGEQLMHLVDVLHHETQFVYPDWHIIFDTDGELAEKTRRTFLGNAANRNILTMFYHLPFPGLGHVKREDGSFRWKPIKS
jgi:glyoxylase-like metal-dependent hydrolase (beta-lactamase superfamily II)